MTGKDKTKEQLITELAELRQRVAELEASEVEREQAEEIGRQNKFLESVLESITYPFLVVDAADYTIKMANSATAVFGDLTELADRLKAMRPGIKVLFISGYIDDAIAHYGISDADSAFLQKPFSPATLTLKVRQVLDG